MKLLQRVSATERLKVALSMGAAATMAELFRQVFTPLAFVVVLALLLGTIQRWL